MLDPSRRAATGPCPRCRPPRRPSRRPARSSSPRHRSLEDRHPQMLLRQRPQPTWLRQCEQRNQPCRRQQIRVVEHRRPRRGRVSELHLRHALCAAGTGTLSNSDTSATRGHSWFTASHATHLIGGLGLAGPPSSRVMTRNALQSPANSPAAMGCGRWRLPSHTSVRGTAPNPCIRRDQPTTGSSAAQTGVTAQTQSTKRMTSEGVPVTSHG
jgi:hypothetical protein